MGTMSAIVPNQEDSWRFANFPGIIPSVGIMAFAFMCHHNTFLIYESIERATQQKWDVVTHWSLFTSFLIATAFGIIGYATFTAYVQGDLMENYCWDDDLMNFARVMFSGTILLTFPIECFVTREVILTAIKGTDELEDHTAYVPNSDRKYLIITLTIVIVAYLISMSTDCLGLVLELNGILAAVPLAYVLPGLCYLKLEEGPVLSSKKLPALGLMTAGGFAALSGLLLLILNRGTSGSCVHGKINEGDGLPPVICLPCNQRLDASYNFKCQIQNSDEKLRQLLKFKSPSDDSVSSEIIVKTITADMISSQKENSKRQEVNSTNFYPDEKQHIKNVPNNLLEDSMRQINSVKHEALSVFDEHTEHNEVIDSVGYITSIKEEELSLESTLFGSDVNNIEALDNSQVLEETSKTNGTQDDEDTPLISHITKFRCTLCMKYFCSKKSLQRHASSSVHTRRTKLQYICYVCDKHYSTLGKMENHVVMHHETDWEEENSKDRRVSYDQDKGVTSIKDKGINNLFDDIFLKDQQTGSKYTCKICLKEFLHQNFFLIHAKSHAEYKEDLDNFYQCSLNKRSVEAIEDGKENTKDGKIGNFPAKSLQCTQCEKQFTTKRNLRRHLFIHTGIKYTCRTCGKGFSRVDKLKDHELIQHMAGIFDSSELDDSDDMDSINMGGCVEKEKKSRYNRPHKCANCPKSFARAQSLVNHLKRHVRANQITKKYLCEVCSKCFAQNASLTIHMRTHTGVKPYACSMCSKAFPKSSSLQRHLRTHSGEKPYICQYCSRAFARANTLARHITTHTGEAKYHCEVCTKSFKRLASLNQHIHIHTGQRPHVCKLCTRTFTNTGSLYIHKKKCKGEQPCNTEVTVSMENSVIQHDVNVPCVFIYSRKELVEDTIVGQIMPTPQYMITNVHNQDLLIN
ncbi:zinc finger protein 420-like isoform X2 [Hylaeus volcanicus]|nr:zinc finger protein 420-like isoform X2 [Hylaeus volcanicus]